jgi:hypothetical protein
VSETAQSILANEVRKSVAAIRTALVKEETPADARAIHRLLVEAVMRLQEQIDDVASMLPPLPRSKQRKGAPSPFLVTRLSQQGRLERDQWLEAVAKQARVFVQTMRQRGLSHQEVDTLDRLLGMEPNKE